jgi:hypothetical protein
MTAFDKSKFMFDGMYLECEGRFVAIAAVHETVSGA